MATQQDINDAVRLNDIINQLAYGYDSSTHAKRDAGDFVRLGGQARFNELMKDPEIKQYISAGSGNSLISSAKAAAPYLGIGAGMYGLTGAMGTGGILGVGGAESAGMTSAELAASDPYLASISGSSGVTPAMESAGIASAAASPGALSGLSSNIAGAGMDLAAGITPEVLQAATASPSLMEQLLASTGMSPNTLSSLASGAASLYGSNLAAGSAADAAEIQQKATDAALAEQKRQFDLAQAAQMPWRTAGESALGEQVNLMGLGPQGAEGQLASLMKAPGYEFRLGEGQKAIERSASAKGGLFSGGAGKALTRYGQDYATNEYGNRLAQLSSLSGQGQSAASGQAGLGMQYGGNVSNLLTNMGSAQAASNIAQGSAKQAGILGAGQALSNLFNPPKQQPTIADLLKGWNYGYRS